MSTIPDMDHDLVQPLLSSFENKFQMDSNKTILSASIQKAFYRQENNKKYARNSSRRNYKTEPKTTSHLENYRRKWKVLKTRYLISPRRDNRSSTRTQGNHPNKRTGRTKQRALRRNLQTRTSHRLANRKSLIRSPVISGTQTSQ